ncbi:Ankyrin repeat containing protein [Acanthamoeba castellanii str. Neff]|uniref:Ankyrin repeat containing protein n=1 Tax=Acanthamoeba castellanii (strain ATCC 30010 / Neff) TaxID=1257118 RepID=L8GV67_ACACF|nr:Ankyrin repeat containing protein [Acanthamoeba castellanii str. Neff]ELR16905.1 Ankyrin repeat containing protein [Acanthamoeba castellanii str. Neff]
MADSIVEAAKDGLTREVQWFLAQGEDVNVTDSDGRTALHWALQKGHGDCVVTLLRAGADLDLKDNDGNPPLHIAVRHNHLQLVKLLVKAGADLRLVDARSLNSYNLARGILGTQSEVTKFLAEIMEKIAPGSTDASKSTTAETPQPKHAGLGTDVMGPTTSAVTLLVITYAGISLAVVELSEDLSESLASVRAKMEEDETTGALVTRKQETLVYQIEIAKQEKPTRGQFLSAADLDL